MPFVLTGAVVSSMVLSSCGDDDDDDFGVPSISYVRPIAAESSDSLLSAAALKNSVVLVGENLRAIDSIFFNDVKAYISPTYQRQNNIILQVPSAIPGTITNMLYYWYKGQKDSIDFVAQVPAPAVRGFDLSKINTESLLFINGDFFVGTDDDPVEVTFPGNVKAEVIAEASNYSQLCVKVPDDVQEGTVSIKSAFGISEAEFSKTVVLFEGDEPLTWSDNIKISDNIAGAKKMLFHMEGYNGWWVGIRFRFDPAGGVECWSKDVHGKEQFDFSGIPEDGSYIGELPEQFLNIAPGAFYVCGGSSGGDGSVKIKKIELVY